jgi:hypothetical protein
MKLNKENFNKTIEKDIVRYSYNCNDTNFYLELVGKNKGRNINVFSGSLDDRQNLLTTTDSLQAWNHFEDLLKVCGGEQGSSGGANLGNNPQQNPNILPLLAIGDSVGGYTQVTLFAIMEDKTQTKVFDFNVESNTLPTSIPKSVFIANWQDQDIPQIFKCDVLLKEFDGVTFGEEPTKKVFVFIPKSMVNQGGEEGGNTQEGQEGEGESEGEGKEGEGNGGGGQEGEEKEGQEGSGGEGQETEEGEGEGEGEAQEGEGGSEGEGEAQEGEGEGQESEQTQSGEGEAKEGQPKQTQEDDGGTEPPKNQTKVDFGQTIQQLANSTNGEYSPSELLSIFRNAQSGELWLLGNNFNKIKKDLNLPQNMSARELSQIIINSK